MGYKAWHMAAMEESGKGTNVGNANGKSGGAKP